jgi:hypothetical protein
MAHYYVLLTIFSFLTSAMRGTVIADATYRGIPGVHPQGKGWFTILTPTSASTPHDVRPDVDNVNDKVMTRRQRRNRAKFYSRVKQPEVVRRQAQPRECLSESGQRYKYPGFSSV